MNDWQLGAYVHEVQNQATMAKLAASDLQNALTAGDIDRMFFSLQAMLSGAAMLSKLLWPNPNNCDERGQPLDAAGQERRRATITRGRELRGALGLASLPILESRQLRNDFEHFDTRLDGYFASLDEDDPRNIADFIVGPADMISSGGGGSPRYLRSIDPDSGTAHVLDHSLDLKELLRAVVEVGGRAEAWIDARGGI
jgi:hypothetical protein